MEARGAPYESGDGLWCLQIQCRGIKTKRSNRQRLNLLVRRRGDHRDRPDAGDPWIEPNLAGALGALTERQRVAVSLVHGYGWTLREVADLCGLQITSVQNHLERGLARLRDRLGVTEDA